MQIRLRLAALVAAASIVHAPALAGRTCTDQPPTATSVANGLALAERTHRALEASGARVVVLARAGQDLSRYGLAWSHLGLAYREPPRDGSAAPAAWRIVHKLNHCGSAQADVYRQGLGEFFLDDPWRYEAAFVTLQPEYEQRLLATLADDARATALHTRAYSIVAYPWSQRYQQSNQWAIETLASAIEPDAADRARAQAWLRLKGYQPTTLRINAFERLGARLGAANVAFDDHPNDRRYTDRIDSVTVDSVFAWLQRSGLGAPLRVVR